LLVRICWPPSFPRNLRADQPSAELFFFFDDLLLLQRGGWQVFFGELGPRAANLLAYLPTLEGVRPCPAGMNPASWMLDSLQGFDSTSGGGAAEATSSLAAAADKKGAAIAADPLLSVAPAALGGGGGAAPGSVPPPKGDVAQAAFFASPLGKNCLLAVEGGSTPTGQSRVSFASSHAAGVGAQLAALLKRNMHSYERNVGLNFGRLVALSMLNLLFGIIWFGIARDAGDASGVQSLVSCIFMGAAFGAMVNMNQIVPALLSVRVVFYREQAAAMYSPSVYQLAAFLVEVPWLAGILLVATSIGYFMFGLAPRAFGFHYLACVVLAVVYVSIGMTVASFVPTFEVAQAVLGLLGPLFFLFGGLWSPPPQMAEGARWFCWIDPITYAFKALIPQQFYSGSDGPGVPSMLLTGPTPPCSPSLPAGVPCGGSSVPGGAVVLNGNILFNVDRYVYVSQKYDVWFDQEWQSLGYLASECSSDSPEVIDADGFPASAHSSAHSFSPSAPPLLAVFIVVFQLFALYGINRIRHIVR